MVGRGPRLSIPSRAHPQEPSSCSQRLSSRYPRPAGLARGQPRHSTGAVGLGPWVAGYLLHCTLPKPVAALFSSSVVFCSCTEVLANSGSLLRSMITISISGSKCRDQDEPGQRPRPRFTDMLMLTFRMKPQGTTAIASAKVQERRQEHQQRAAGEIRHWPEPLCPCIPASPGNKALILTRKRTNCNNFFYFKFFCFFLKVFTLLY